MERVWACSVVLTTLLVLIMACAGSILTPTPFQTAFPSAPDCPGFEAEREIILRTVPEGLGSGGVYSEQGYRCTPNGFSVSGTVSPGHTYGVSITRYDTEVEVETALGTPNSTFRNSPAVHSYESRNGGFITEALAWRESRWVFRASSFDDTPYRFAPPDSASERMHDAAVDLGLFTVAASPPSIIAPTPSDAQIEFVMNQKYALGEAIEIRIRNKGNASYFYHWNSGCPGLKSYGTDGPSAIHTSFHCDLIITKEIRPGEEAALWTWHQYQCIAGDFFACYQVCRVKPGKYGVVETFYREGQKQKSVVEWTFIITSADGQDALPTVGPGRPPPTPTRECGEAILEISVNEDGQFEPDKLQAVAGSEAVVSLNNRSKVPQNWVLVKPGTQDEVARRGGAAGFENDFVQPGDPDVFAHVRLLYPGETGEVRFTAPAVGTYQFISTFPGYNFFMFGRFVVTP